MYGRYEDAQRLVFGKRSNNTAAMQAPLIIDWILSLSLSFEICIVFCAMPGDRGNHQDGMLSEFDILSYIVFQ